MTWLKRVGLAIVAIAALGFLPIMGGSPANASPTISLKGVGVTDKSPLLQEVRKRRKFGRSGKRFRGKRFKRRMFGKKFRRKFRARRKLRRHRRFRRSYGPRIIIGSGAYGYSRYYDDYYYYSRGRRSYSCGSLAAKRACADKYRSFEWNTCYYTTYSGYKRLCPYVR